MSAHAEHQSTSRRKLEDSLEEPIAEVQVEDLCSSGDEMVCDTELISVADSEARDAVILLQCYFEYDGGTEFLPRLSAMHSYVRNGYLRHRILCSRCHGSAICAIAGARWCEEAWEVYDSDDGEESCHNQANREWTFAARCRRMTVDAEWRSSLSSDDDNDDRPQPSAAEIANAVTILLSVYGDDVTLAQIRANQIASKRSLRQGSIKDFFKPA
ncbi:hypothetical protein HPB51_014243 [Rhipicephalus microplus]|uniref:Uncharacterized protein n=1 Tax=Rhipicephalus microplus TaxID=6941 RepID=A0A9J6D5F8_RHIMP|nr:hypothetical protein HPB51_014243 [Rhipicephalus microplus]